LIILVVVGVGVAWYTGNLPGTMKYEQKRYITYEVIPLLNEMAAKNFNHQNRPSIEDARKILVVCDGMEKRDIVPRDVKSTKRRVLEACRTESIASVMSAHEFYRDFVALKEKDPTFENPNQDSQMCLRLEEMNSHKIFKAVSDYDTHKDDLELLAESCQ